MGSIGRNNSCCNVGSALVVGKRAASTDGATLNPGNRLLAALPREALLRIQPHLELVSFARGQVICEADTPSTRVYFVEKGVVSLMAVFQDRTTAEMATVGREGMVGISTILGGDFALGRHVAPMHGLALATEVSRFRSLLQESPSLRETCGAYAEVFLREALQTAACNSVHSVEERSARWLLTCDDRSDGDTITLTQDCLAETLGVCRSTVTIVAGALQKAELIRYRRGAITVVDRTGLEAVSCECYRVIRQHYERLLPRTYKRQPLRIDERPFLRAIA
jgi:CRP-like cAMP-binding protein